MHIHIHTLCMWYVYLSLYVCVYDCLCVNVCECVYVINGRVCKYVYMHVVLYLYVYVLNLCVFIVFACVCVYVFMNMSLCVYVCVYVCSCVCMYVFVCVYVKMFGRNLFSCKIMSSEKFDEKIFLVQNVCCLDDNNFVEIVFGPKFLLVNYFLGHILDEKNF